VLLTKRKAVLPVLLVLILICGLGACRDSAVIPETQPPPSPAPTIDLPPAPEKPPEPYEGVSNGELRDVVEERYGIEIYWDAEYEIPFFKVEPLGDRELIREFLIMLDEQLALYPPGFFSFFKDKGFTPVRFLPVPYLTDYAGSPPVGGSSGFDSEGMIHIALDATYADVSWPETITYAGCPYLVYALHHEIGHIVELYLLNHSGTPLFDNYAWAALLPNGNNSYYDNVPAEEKQAGYSLLEHASQYLSEEKKGVWFCDAYSQLNANEHLASLFGYAMCPSPPAEFYAPHVQAQMDYYFPLIRKGMDTGGWPESVYWEGRVANAA
jgi:hypothetical protein